MTDTAAAGASEMAASDNVWLKRREFYHSAIPRDSAEEEKMLAAALALSRQEHYDNTRSSVLAYHHHHQLCTQLPLESDAS